MAKKHAVRAKAGGLAVAVIAGLAGCGGQSAPASSAMEKQIAAGEKVGDSTRASASRSGSGSALSSGQAVPGRNVTAIGDSVMSASAMALADALPGIYIDAKPDREMPAGLAILRRLAASGQLRRVVVVGLGTNYIVTTAQLQQVMQIIGPRRRLVLINTYVDDGWSKQVNATEAAFVQRHPSVVPADWFDTIKNRLDLLWPDQVHPQIPGTIVYARVVDQAIQATRGGSGSSPAAQPAVADRASPAPPSPQPHTGN